MRRSWVHSGSGVRGPVRKRPARGARPREQGWRRESAEQGELSEGDSGAAGSPGAQFPYEGEAGRTRLEAVHVPIPGGLVQSVQVYRAVNVAEDPELREPALTGALHRFEGGEELAVPFVYHDPSAAKLALVVPEVLRHQALRERARLLEQLAADAAHPVPPYVREATVVIGDRELRAYLEAIPPSPEDETRPGLGPGARERSSTSGRPSSPSARRI